MRDDDRALKCQLLDNHSSLRPLFGDIPVHAATASAWFSSVLYCGSFTYLRLFFFTPFPTIATHEKGTAKYSTSLNENIQETEMHYLKTLFFD